MAHLCSIRRSMALTAISLAIVCLGAGCASYVLLRPTHDERDTAGATSQFLKVGDRQIEIWSIRTPACGTQPPKAFVLHFNGNVSRADDDTPAVARVWANQPVEVWGVNYPKYGKSDGPSRLKALPPVALAAFDSLKQLAGDRPIFLSSNSIGGTCVIYLAGRRDVAGLVIQNPPPLRRLVLGHYGWWNLWLLATPVELGVPHELNTTETGALAKAPACFVFSSKDPIIPPFYHALVFDAYGGPKQEIDLPKADHDLHVDGPQMPQVRAWIDRRWAEVLPAH